MSAGRVAILAGVALALMGFVLIDNWQPQRGFIWNIQNGDSRVTVGDFDAVMACIRNATWFCIRRIEIPYPAILVISIAAIACGIYMENSDRWKGTRL
jgi:hypothetical protein